MSNLQDPSPKSTDFTDQYQQPRKKKESAVIKKKLKKAKKVYVDLEPNRSAVQVFDKQMEDQTICFQNEKPVKSTQYQNIRHLRQNSWEGDYKFLHYIFWPSLQRWSILF